jgi:N-acetylmuramoyl-L-alanine amidase
MMKRKRSLTPGLKRTRGLLLRNKLHLVMVGFLFAFAACRSVDVPAPYDAAEQAETHKLASSYIIMAAAASYYGSTLYITEEVTEEATEEIDIITGFKVAIDPGHQRQGNYSTEPIGPGSSEYKAKVASGTKGLSTGVPEYVLVLDISLRLRDELLLRGFDVFVVRESHDVNISNSERAVMASESGSDIFVRIHANGSQDRNVHGLMTLSSSRNNLFIPHLYYQNRALSEHMLSAMVKSTGAKNLGVIEVDNMTGTNWSTIPVTIVEMGFMTNTEEDELMQTDEYRRKLVMGMADGIESYFAGWRVQ